MPNTEETWKAFREELAASLETFEGVARAKIGPYLDTFEPKAKAIFAMTPEQARQSIEDLNVNARADAYILGIKAETEFARLVTFGVRLAVGLLRSVVVV